MVRKHICRQNSPDQTAPRNNRIRDPVFAQERIKDPGKGVHMYKGGHFADAILFFLNIP